MKIKHFILDKKTIVGIITVSFLVIAIQVFSGKTGLLSQHQLDLENQKKQATIDSLKQVLKMKTKQIELLKNDSNYMEYMARTKLGMSQENEKAFQFIEESKLK